jgi:hypothetical protein
MINDSIENLESFLEVFETMNYSLSANVGKLVGIQEKTMADAKSSPAIPIADSEGFVPFQSTLAKMNGSFEPVPNLLKDIYNVLDEQLFITKETVEDQKRKWELEGAKNTSKPIPEEENRPVIIPKDDSEGFFANIFGGLSFARILAGFAIAPFVFKFAQGFVSSITDGLVELTATNLFGLAAIAKSVTGIFSSLPGADKIVGLFRSFAAPIVRITNMLSSIAGFVGRAFSMIPGTGVIKTLLGRLAWPITVVLGFVEAWNSFAETDGDFMDKFSAAVGGFFASVIGAPLDLLKDIVGWVLSKFGFENASEALAEFSFSDKIREIVTSAFGFLGSVVDWITDKFAFSTEGTVWEDFSIREMFNDVMEDLKQFFVDLFDFLPSLDVVKARLLSILPEWMQPASVNEQRSTLESELQNAIADKELYDSAPEAIQNRREDPQREIDNLRNQLSELPELARGGIINAPESGGLAMLHGAEIVAPLNSPQGQALAAMNDLMRVANIGSLAKRDYVSANAQQGAIDQSRARTAMMNIMPQMVNTTPVTNNSNSTTIINNMSPSRSLDDPSMLN